MIETQKNGIRSAVENDHGVTNSILNSMGLEENLKRACFIFHYAFESPYKFLFSKSWAEYHEQIFMQKMNVEYHSGDREKEVGPVARLGDDLFAAMVKRAKGRLSYKHHLSVNVRFNKEMVIKESIGPSTRGSNFKYYLKLGGVDTVEVRTMDNSRFVKGRLQRDLTQCAS